VVDVPGRVGDHQAYAALADAILEVMKFLILTPSSMAGWIAERR